MQYTGFSLLSLSLSAHVFAAPILDVASPTIEVVDSTLSTVQSETGILRKDVVTTVTGEAGQVLDLPIVENVESILRKDCDLCTLSDTVSTLMTSIKTDAASITTTIAGDVTESVVPSVLTSLGSIVSNINGTVLTVVPVVTSTVLPLAASEVEGVVSTLANVQTIVSDVKSVLTSLISAIEPDVLAMISSEISEVLNIVLPLVSPLTGFALNVAGSIVESDGTVSQLKSSVVVVEDVLNDLLDPVGAILSALL